MKAAPTPAPSAQRYQTPTPSLPSRLPERNLNTCRHAALARGRGGAPGTGRGSTACKVAASENGKATKIAPWRSVKPADSRESPFKDLELMELWDGTGKTRVRQHVNPLRADFQRPTPPPDWAAVYSDPTLPLVIDIGSGYGRFLLLLQRHNPDRPVNYLGIEIRRPLVERANEWASRLGVSGRVHYVFANATVSLRGLLAGYPGGVCDAMVQFPDPHFKRRHHKRRVVQRELVQALGDVMGPGGRLLLQSDVEDVAAAMRDQFERHGSAAFELAPEHATQPVFFSPPPSTAQQHQDQQVSSSSSNGNGNGAGSEHVAAPGGVPVGAAASNGHGQEQAQGHPPASSSGAAVGYLHQQQQQQQLQQGNGGLDLGEPAGSLTSLAATLIAAANSREGWAAALAAAASEHNGGALPHDASAAAAAGHSGGVVHSAGGAAASNGRVEELVRAEPHGDNSAGSRSGSEEGSDGDGPESGTGEEDGEGEVEVGDVQLVWAQGGWLVDNPVGTPTEREHYVLQQGLPVFRVLLARK